MQFAAIETSGDLCSVALWRDGETAALERRGANGHSELALPMLEALLDDAKTNLEALDAIAFGAGPGAFTGLRIACGLAQGLAFARGLPVLGVSSLEALAEEAAAPRVIACIDARMGEVYYAALEKRAGAWHEVVAAQCVAPARATPPPGAGWVGCGSGFAAHPAFLERSVALALPDVRATATAVARLAAPRLAAGQGVDAALALPVYLRDKVALTTRELEAR